MKPFFLATLAVLVALSFVAQLTKPRLADPSKIPLIWSSDDNPLRREQLDPFNLLYPRFDLRLDPGSTELEKVIVQSLAGVGPDVFDCWSGSALTAFVKADIAWDVTDELAKRGVDVARETWPGPRTCAMYDGRVYGFPENAGANGLWFHKDILADA